MAQPGSRGEFIDYCKRQLGAPVLEINIADEQVEDIVDDAIQFFNERHFDGVSQVFLKYQITQDDIDRGTASMEEGADTQLGITTFTSETKIAGVTTSFSNPYTLTTSPFRFRTTIDSNNVCDAPTRYPSVIITPTGSTTLASGVNALSGNTSQTAGPVSSTFTPSVSFSVTENSRVLTYVGGAPRFAAGSSWTVTATVGVDTTKVNYYSLGWYRGNASTNTTGTTIANNAGSGTYTFNITGGDTGYVRFHVNTYANSTPPNCYTANPFKTDTSNYYP